MKKILLIALSVQLLNHVIKAQSPIRYQDSDGNTHLVGPITVNNLQSDTTYAKWFNAGYADFELTKTNYKWVKNLKDDKVQIFLGTWCGDSQEWVPRFIKLWDALGLKRNQLEIIALYGNDEQYKQGPNAEEKGLNIHRVPTFIFKENAQEYARIVESPSTDLFTDVAQTALGYPSAPKYKGATYFLNLFDSMSVKEMYDSINTIYRNAYYKIGNFGELQTLGRVLSTSDRKQEALYVLNLNTYYHAGNWRTHKRLADLQMELKDYERAKASYQRVLELDPDNKAATDNLKELETLMDDTESGDDQ